MPLKSKDDKHASYYDGETDKVKRLVTKKLQHYFNTERVENEFDSSGRGLHSTTPLVGRLELAYLTATHKPPQRAKRSIAKSSNTCNKRKPLGNHRKQETKDTSAKKKQDNNNESSTETKDSVSEDRTTKDNASEDRKTKDNVLEDRKTKDNVSEDRKTKNNVSEDRKGLIVSPRVKVNSQIKGRVNGDEVSRLAKNAEALLMQVPVETIETVHRFRRQPVVYEAAQKGKVPHISSNVHAVLNTENALQFTQENEERKLAKEYLEKKNKNLRQKKKKSREQQSSNISRSSRIYCPLSQRIETENTADDPQRSADEEDGKPDGRGSRDNEDVHVTIPVGAVTDDDGNKELVSNNDVDDQESAQEDVSSKDDKNGDEDETNQNGVGSDLETGALDNIDDLSEDGFKNEEDGKGYRYDTDSIGTSGDKKSTVDPFYDNNHRSVDSTSVVSKRERLNEDAYDNDSFAEDDDGVIASSKGSLHQGEDKYDNDSFTKDNNSAIVSHKGGTSRDEYKYDNDSFVADSTSSEMQLADEAGLQDNYSDASWDEEEEDGDDGVTLDGRSSRMMQQLEVDDERTCAYSPDPDFDQEERNSQMSLSSAKLPPRRRDSASGSVLSGDRRRGSNASSTITMDYVRTESVVSLTELVRSSSIKEEKD